MKNKIDWAVIIKIKPRATVDVHNTIELAHQEYEMVTSNVPTIVEEIVGPLLDENAEFEEINENLGGINEDDELNEASENSSYDNSSGSIHTIQNTLNHISKNPNYVFKSLHKKTRIETLLVVIS